MRNAASFLLIVALAGCGGGRETNDPAQGNEVALTNETLANAEIEALPADESATTSSEELANGASDQGAGDLGNQH